MAAAQVARNKVAAIRGLATPDDDFADPDVYSQVQVPADAAQLGAVVMRLMTLPPARQATPRPVQPSFYSSLCNSRHRRAVRALSVAEGRLAGAGQAGANGASGRAVDRLGAGSCAVDCQPEDQAQRWKRGASDGPR